MFTFITGLIAVLVCGALIGYERQFKSKIIGIRTCILIMLGSFVFTYISIKIGGDPSRVAAQIASGVGFIGAGIIFKNGIDDIRHLTTAVLAWVLAALGSLISLGYLFESLMITGIIYIILKIKILKWLRSISYITLYMKKSCVS